jgi:mono/diheme cytochrome c family protein
MRTRLLSSLLLTALSACQAAPPITPPQTALNVATGKAIAEQHCSGCHAIGRKDASPHPDAPAFRDISRNYPPEMLAEALAEGLETGHPDMPVFVFGERENDALIAYLKSIQAPLET